MTPKSLPTSYEVRHTYRCRLHAHPAVSFPFQDAPAPFLHSSAVIRLQIALEKRYSYDPNSLLWQ